MPFCSLCGLEIPDNLERHKKFCFALDSDESDDELETYTLGNPGIQSETTSAIRTTNLPGTLASERSTLREDRASILSPPLDYGGPYETTYELRLDPDPDPDPKELSYDLSVFLDQYFDNEEENSEEDEEDSEQEDDTSATPPRTTPQTKGGIKIVDNRDLPAISNKTFWNIQLGNIVQKHNLPREAHADMINFCNRWRESNDLSFERLDSVHVADKQMIRSFPVSSQMFDICKNGCMLFEDDDQWGCDHCPALRFKDEDGEHPVAQMRYLSISDLLGCMLANPAHREMFREMYNRNVQESLVDCFDGSVFTQFEHLFSNEFDVALALYVDGFTPFRYGGKSSISMTMVHLVVLNLPKDERYKLRNMLQVAVIPGPTKPKNIHSFLSPLMDELRSLATTGMILKVDNEDDITLHAHLVLASGDIPGVADLIHHSGHNSEYGCRTCHIKSDSLISPKDRGKGRYYPGTGEPSEERTEADFKGERPYGIEQCNPFTELPTHHSPCFYGLDELHLIGQNLSRQIWGMLKDEYPNPETHTPFALDKVQRAKIGKALKSSHLIMPLGLNGALGDIFAHPKSSRGVDWIDFLLYAVPTIVVESLEKNGCESLGHLANLVSACSIALSWDISVLPEREGKVRIPSDMERLESQLQEWHIFMRDEMPNNLYTINQHYLQHLPKIIESLGPLRSISARSMERAIGEIKSYIKSRVAPGVNASNALLKVAAS